MADRLLYCAEHGDELAAVMNGVLSVRMIPANSPLNVPDDLIGVMTISQRHARFPRRRRRGGRS